LEPNYFLRADDGKPIAENFTITEKIPMQIVFTKGMLIMEKASEQGLKTLTFLVLANIALQLFM
jgi:hypothetical protein